MTRSPSVPCSMGCGRLLWHNRRTSRPKDQIRCQPCSATLPKVKKRWKQVGPRPCIDCQQLTTRKANQFGVLCLACSAMRRQAKNRRKNTRRRGVPKPSVRITLAQLAARDGFVCHLCATPVDMRLRAPDPMSATADHLVPVSLGGSDEPSNLALAHRDCNTRRGNRLLDKEGDCVGAQRL